MFMRVNPGCAHHMRPPPGKAAALACRKTLGDYSFPIPGRPLAEWTSLWLSRANLGIRRLCRPQLSSFLLPEIAGCVALRAAPIWQIIPLKSAEAIGDDALAAEWRG